MDLKPPAPKRQPAPGQNNPPAVLDAGADRKRVGVVAAARAAGDRRSRGRGTAEAAGRAVVTNRLTPRGWGAGSERTEQGSRDPLRAGQAGNHSSRTSTATSNEPKHLPHLGAEGVVVVWRCGH